ncbi:hypothetical protein ADU59_01280 (plasmid) [Pararhizobium polonicum]|jgi:hypothetical protein|uniref:Uncharacterized protein n=1 Tax=Pararhizobium polonicum TaxID=1612624 RepID=A0A1C7P8N6_9HYPH|nr:hypothetical protein ADU59_01280 [Pararhizobium polonicum]
MLILAKKSSSLSDDTKLDGETKLVVSPSAQFAFETIAGIQRVVADETVFVRRQAQKVLRFCCADQFPSTHSLTPMR